jgi:hypothetical protein
MPKKRDKNKKTLPHPNFPIKTNQKTTELHLNKHKTKNNTQNITKKSPSQKTNKPQILQLKEHKLNHHTNPLNTNLLEVTKIV